MLNVLSWHQQLLDVGVRMRGAALPAHLEMQQLPPFTVQWKCRHAGNPPEAGKNGDRRIQGKGGELKRLFEAFKFNEPQIGMVLPLTGLNLLAVAMAESPPWFAWVIAAAMWPLLTAAINLIADWSVRD